MQYDTIASDAVIKKTAAALTPRNITASVVATKAEALQKIEDMIPANASVMTGSSVTLEEIGFVDLLKSGNHPWKNLKDSIVSEPDKAKQSFLRREATLADYFLGSVHAVTEEGQILIGSNTGSQLPAYTFTAGHVIWVVGAQKIVPNLAEAWKRIEEYVVPLEDVHMQQLYGIHTNLSKALIFNKEPQQNRIDLIFVKEKLGF